jgi:hypothetical protein
MRHYICRTIPFAICLFSTQLVFSFQQGTTTNRGPATERIHAIVSQVIKASYPELTDADIRVVAFTNSSDYFRTRFTIPQFMTGQRMQYLIRVNPEVFSRNCPDSAIRAIVAHELGHVLFFKQRNRLRLLGLVRLESKSYTAEFERWTDLQAISRGYSAGLKEYRRWLYQNVPPGSLAEKRRDYFSPEEIDAIMLRIKTDPKLMNYWLSHVPLSLREIEQQK